jgi:prephenate dehydrogenase
MAGSEKRGVEFARADLFDNALCLITPTDRTSPKALKEVDEFWQTLGMRITHLSPAEHDRRLAEVSHLPHALAAAMVSMADRESLDLAGKGFIDLTRIASGDGGLWRDILLDNRDNVLGSIDKLKAMLAELETLINRGDSIALKDWLDSAAARRTEMVERRMM